MKELKVLIVLDTLHGGGAEVSTLQIIKHVRNISFYVMTLYGGGSLEREYREHAQGVYLHELTDKYGFVKAAKLVRNVVDELSPQIVHANLFRTEIACRIALWSRKEVELVGSFVSDSYSSFRYGSKGSTLAKLKLFGLQTIDFVTKRRVDKYIAITHYAKQENARSLRIDPERIEVIYRGRSVRHFTRVDHQKIRDGSKITLLTTARQYWHKGFREALMAVAHLDHPNIEYLIAGSGNQSDAIKEFAKTLPNPQRVIFLGHVDDVSSLLASANFFIMPSHYEGLGGAVIEAMISRVPLIVSDIPVFREVTGNNAIFFEVSNTDDLRLNLQRLIDGKISPDVSAAHKLAIERYDIVTIAKQYEKFYTELA